MYVASIHSRKKIVHKQNCRHVRNIRMENRIYFRTMEEAAQSGYHICLDCSDIVRYYKREEKQILAYCMDNGMSAFINRPDGSLDILTPCSSWKIFIRGRQHSMVLYHKNTFCIDGEVSDVPGYHYQNVHRSEILQFMQYIICHDFYRLQNPVRVPVRYRYSGGHCRKGTKRYKKQQKRLYRIRRRQEIRRVEKLLQALEA